MGAATERARVIAKERTAGDQASELHKIMRLLVLVVGTAGRPPGRYEPIGGGYAVWDKNDAVEGGYAVWYKNDADGVSLE